MSPEKCGLDKVRSRLGKLEVGGDEIRSKVVDIRDGVDGIKKNRCKYYYYQSGKS